ncbi:hypothetical protein F5B20DRAFT_591668 [Whalleya microplaca]|nr:hypothetical protein F5B20DRAFT_591668 [Whalleya microplaca]
MASLKYGQANYSTKREVERILDSPQNEDLDLSHGNAPGHARFEALLRRHRRLPTASHLPQAHEARETDLGARKGGPSTPARTASSTWRDRADWQQIANFVSGVARAQGKSMRSGQDLVEPVVLPLPISDYGCDCMCAMVALAGLHHRSKQGGLWIGRTLMLQYDTLAYIRKNPFIFTPGT